MSAGTDCSAASRIGASFASACSSCASVGPLPPWKSELNVSLIFQLALQNFFFDGAACAADVVTPSAPIVATSVANTSVFFTRPPERAPAARRANLARRTPTSSLGRCIGCS